MGPMMDDSENKFKEDCDQLYVVLKNCERPDNDQDAASYKILYRLSLLLSYRPGSKLVMVTAHTVRYLCHHPMLPVVLVEILRDSKNMKVCAYVLDILSKLIPKTSIVHENERKAIRKTFYDPHHFKTVLQAFHNLDEHFQNEKTNPQFYDLQVRFLKVINCMYSRKGQAQLTMIPDSTVEFIAQHFHKYRAYKDIARTILPLIKTLCRSKKNCNLICKENFINTLAITTPMVNKYPATISILRFLSRCPEALLEMSQTERIYHFIISTAICHGEKVNNKKYLMGTLYRLSKTPQGMHNLKKNCFWLSLLDFFSRSERLDELRTRMAYTRAYTILHRGLHNKFVNISPISVYFGFCHDIQHYIKQRSSNQSDDSDNEESDDEEEHKADVRNRTMSEDSPENDEENGYDDLSEDTDDDYVEMEDEEELQSFSNLNCSKKDLKELHEINKFYLEFQQSIPKDPIADLEDCVRRHSMINRQALPDLINAESIKDDGIVVPQTNVYNIEELVNRIKNMKSHGKEEIPRKVVFDLDKLIEDNNNTIDVPNLAELRLKYTKRSLLSLSVGKTRSSPSLAFESRFECGNLRKVEQIGDYEYDLFLSPDVNMTCGLQWFYFQVSRTVAYKHYAFNIVNFQKCNSQFSYGLQPVMFSSASYIVHGEGWKKIGDKLIYFGNEYINKDTNKQFRTLRFELTFPYDDDYVYIAYHFPYTYSKLLRTLTSLLKPQVGLYARLDVLTLTVGGLNQVPLITVTAPSNDTNLICIKRRKIVFLTSRVHPGESNASWIMDGLLKFLLSDHYQAKRAREGYIFKIIPMLNPEGVIYGNTRCGLTGNDLNRCWKKPHPVLHPEIYYAKKLVEYAREKLSNEIFAFIDIHGHSRKKFFFLYGCNPKLSWMNEDANNNCPDKYNLLPKALSINPNMKMSYCRFTIERKRETTCRVVMWREFGIQCSYTLECSFCSGENKKKITTHMLQEIGASVIIALADLTSISFVS